MKRKFKLLIIFAVAMLTSLSLTLSAFAEEAVEEKGRGQDIFESIFSVVTDNSDTVFSLLAFIGAISVAAIYKKGLLPKLKNAGGIIGNAVEQIKEENKALAKTASDQQLTISSMKETLISLGEKIETLAERLSESTRHEERVRLGEIMDTQVELLRDVFVSSSLPQYQKEAVEAKVKEMKERINGEIGE